MTTSEWVQYATTELIHTVLYCYGFMLLNEDIKNTWFVKLYELDERCFLLWIYLFVKIYRFRGISAYTLHSMIIF
jgi:hypothetical protein